MSDTHNFRTFIEELMTLNAGYSGMGGAQAGIIGSGSTETDIVNELRRQALALGAAFANGDRKQIAEYAQKVEGSLQSLHMVSTLSDKRLATLTGELYALVARYTHM